MYSSVRENRFARGIERYHIINDTALDLKNIIFLNEYEIWKIYFFQGFSIRLRAIILFLYKNSPEI